MENKDEFSLTLDPSAHGAALRDHLVKLQNLFGSFNEAHDEALLVYDRAKLILEEVTEKVNSSMPIPGPKIKTGKLLVEVVLEDGIVYTLLQAKKELNEAKYNLSLAKSKLNELKSAIDTTRSALVWDRAELEHM